MVRIARSSSDSRPSTPVAKRFRSSSHPVSIGFKGPAPFSLQTSFYEDELSHLPRGKQSPSPAGVEAAARFSRDGTPTGELQQKSIAEGADHQSVAFVPFAPIERGTAAAAVPAPADDGEFEFLDGPGELIIQEYSGDSFQLHLSEAAMDECVLSLSQSRISSSQQSVFASFGLALSQISCVLTQDAALNMVKEHYNTRTNSQVALDYLANEHLDIYQSPSAGPAAAPAPSVTPITPRKKQTTPSKVTCRRAASLPIAKTPKSSRSSPKASKPPKTPRSAQSSLTCQTSKHLTALVALLKRSRLEGVPSLVGWIETLEALDFFNPLELTMLVRLRDHLTAKKVAELWKYAHSHCKKDLDFQNEFIRQVFAWSGRKAAGGSQDEKDREIMLKMVLWTTVVIAAYPSYADVLISLDTFRRTYEQQMGVYEAKLRKEPHVDDFLRVSLLEEEQVLQYCNVVRVGLEIMPFHQNKHTLHSIAVLIEQSGARHTLGGALGKEAEFREAVLDAEGAKQSVAHPKPTITKRNQSI